MKNMENRIYVACRILVVVGSVLFLSACSTNQCASTKPNIVLISANDLGYMNVQEYACHITGEKKRKMYYETPNLNRLCLEGLSFEQAYACRFYLPAHAGILTGRINSENNLKNGDPTGIKREKISIAEVLPDYDSVFIGKWHADGTSAAMGFDQLGLSTVNEDCQVDDLTEQAVQYIESRSKMRHKPFFLYLSHFTDGGLHSVNEKDVNHFIKKRTRGLNGDNDPYHAAMVKGVDDSVGRILHKLWRIGLDNNTVVIFMPANGRVGAESAEADKGSLIGSNMRVPLMIRWKKYVKAGSWSKVPVDYADILPTVMQCAGYFPEALGEDVEMDGCSLSGLFWDTRNKAESYERDIRCLHYPRISGGPGVSSSNLQYNQTPL